MWTFPDKSGMIYIAHLPNLPLIFGVSVTLDQIVEDFRHLMKKTRLCLQH